MANKGGRPRIEIDKHQLEDLMNFRPSTYDCAGHFKCSRETILEFIRVNYDMTFLEFRKCYGYKVKMNLITKAIDLAKRGNTEMIKFCLNNLGGWTNGYNQQRAFEEEESIDSLEWVDP